ncbi:AraC family transcriptional regulator [Paenibacillus sp. ACRRY]|uniref:AraC family transcriptional regulator n=1 Tax=Paenibacillus sp. ACRRY TaxID=2918208 RepID=UPI001EF6B6C8|nr:AraC family transcriptional regulator [Paenibacillus sp. ACRRY]MCG7383648.1 AraC family transcriptional regulator [Paenibacillus sp. ACRRY]
MKKTGFIIDQNLKEMTEHRTDTLSVACYETTIVHNVHGHIPLHWHDELQFVAVLQGTALFHINDQKISVSKGDGIFINSGAMHMAEDNGGDNNCIYLCINLTPQLAAPSDLYVKYVHPYITATNLPFLYIDGGITWGAQILEAIRLIRTELVSQAPYYELKVASALLDMWTLLIKNGYALEHDASEMTRSRRIKDMLQWIHLNYADPVRLEDIARTGQLSRSETCRYFKQILRTTPMQYVMDYRIRKSIELLRLSDRSITEIAYEVGFNSTSYYIHQFRKSMKKTPLRFRREIAEKKQEERND